MDRKIILVDMDGVIANWLKEALRCLNAWVQPEQRRTVDQIKTFYIEDAYPGNDKLIRDIVTSHGFYRDLEEIPGSITAVKNILEMGHEPFLCSSPETNFKEQMCWTEKAQWVEQHMGRKWVDRMILTRDKTLVHGDVLVDDKPSIRGVMTPTWSHLIYPAPYNDFTSGWRGGWETLFHYLNTGEKN
jgi:5'-nucleotidase